MKKKYLLKNLFTQFKMKQFMIPTITRKIGVAFSPPGSVFQAVFSGSAVKGFAVTLMTALLLSVFGVQNVKAQCALIDVNGICDTLPDIPLDANGEAVVGAVQAFQTGISGTIPADPFDLDCRIYLFYTDSAAALNDPFGDSLIGADALSPIPVILDGVTAMCGGGGDLEVGVYHKIWIRLTHVGDVLDNFPDTLEDMSLNVGCMVVRFVDDSPPEADCDTLCGVAVADMLVANPDTFVLATAPDDTTCSATWDILVPQITDNCQIDTLKIWFTAGAPAPDSVLADTFWFIRGVNDNIDDILTCAADTSVTLFGNGGECSAVTTINFMASDPVGQQTMCSYDVTVADSTAPEWIADSIPGLVAYLQDTLKTDTNICTRLTANGRLQVYVFLECCDTACPDMACYQQDSAFLRDLDTAYISTLLTDNCDTNVAVVFNNLRDSSGVCGPADFGRPPAECAVIEHVKDQTLIRWRAFDNCGNSVRTDIPGRPGFDIWIYKVDTKEPIIDTNCVPEVFGKKPDGTYGACIELYATADSCCVVLDSVDTCLICPQYLDCDTVLYGFRVESSRDCFDEPTEFHPVPQVGAEPIYFEGAGCFKDSINCLPVGVHSIRYTAQDRCGLEACDYVLEIHVLDTTPPEFATCPADDTVMTNTGVCFTTYAWTPPYATDNCGGATTVGFEAFDAGGKPITVITADAADCLGDVATFMGPFEPTNWLVNVNGAFDTAYHLFTGPTPPTANELTIVTDPPQFPNPPDPDSYYELYINSIPSTGVLSFCFDHAAGNSDSLGILLDDVEVWNNRITSNTGDGCVNVLVEAGQKLALRDTRLRRNNSDLIISNFSFECSAGAYAVLPAGKNTIRYIAKDTCGAVMGCIEPREPVVDTCEFCIWVVDSQPPVAKCDTFIDMNLGDDCTATLRAGSIDLGSSDNCNMNWIWLEDTTGTITGPDGNGGEYVFTGYADGDTVCLWFIASDTSGNTDTCDVKVALHDVTPPDLVCPPSEQLGTDDGVCTAQHTINVVATDACYASVDSYVVILSGATVDTLTTVPAVVTLNLGLTNVLVMATDSAGNTAICQYTLEVVDDEVPAISVGNVVCNPDTSGACGSIVCFDVTATDNCQLNSVISSPPSCTSLPPGTHTVQVQATDMAGKSDTLYFEVDVVDKTPPTAVCADLTVNLNPGGVWYITAGEVDAGSDDNCGLDSFWITRDSFGCGDVGTVNDIMFIAQDIYGMLDTCLFDVVVTDTQEAQIVNCPADIHLFVDGSCNATVEYDPIMVREGCVMTEATLASGPDSGAVVSLTACPTVMPVQYTYQLSNKTLECNFNVILHDTTPPDVTCPTDVDTIVNWQGECEILVYTDSLQYQPTATDNCSNPVTKIVSPTVLLGVGLNHVQYTFVDDCGNESVCFVPVYVTDTVPPTLSQINCQELGQPKVVVKYLDECGKVDLSAQSMFPGGEDNCGIADYCLKIIDPVGNEHVYCDSDSTLEFDCNLLCDTVCFWYWIEDKAGNPSDTCDFCFVVLDTIAPEVCCELFNDTCVYTSIQEKDSCYAAYSVHIPFALCDTDCVAPTCNADTAYWYDNDSCGSTLHYKYEQVADCWNAAISPPTLLKRDSVTNSGDLWDTYNFPVGRNAIILWAVDAKGNVSDYDTCYVNVIDTIAPWAVCPDNDTVGTNDVVNMTCNWLGELTPPVVTDNCNVETVRVTITNTFKGVVTPVLDTVLYNDKANVTACPTLTPYPVTLPKGVNKVVYTYNDTCEIGTFGPCPTQTNTDSCYHTITVNDSMPVVVCECPDTVCPEDSAAVVYVPVDTSIVDATGCACYGKFTDTIMFKEDCDTITIIKKLYALSAPTFTQIQGYRRPHLTIIMALPATPNSTNTIGL